MPVPPMPSPLQPACALPPEPGRRRALRQGLATVALLAAGSAQALDAPKGKVVLSVVGAVGQTNADGRADFDMAMLEASMKSRFKHVLIETSFVLFMFDFLIIFSCLF